MTTYCYTLYDPIHQSPYPYVPRIPPVMVQPQSMAAHRPTERMDPDEFDFSRYFDLSHAESVQKKHRRAEQREPPMHLSMLSYHNMFQGIYHSVPDSVPSSVTHTVLAPPMHRHPWTPRRRENKGRSTSGCFCCRLRRVRCDESRPKCGDCGRLNIDCDFPCGLGRPRYMTDPIAKKLKMQEIRMNRM